MPLIFLDCDFDFPQDFLGDLADRIAQRIDRVGGIKIKYRKKVLMLIIIVGVYAAAAHYGVRRADGQRFNEGNGDVELVEILKEAALGGVAYVAGVVFIVARRQNMRKANQHIAKIGFVAGYAVVCGNGFHDRQLMLRPHLPNIWAARVMPAALRVRIIENIAKPGFAGAAVDEGDAL